MPSNSFWRGTYVERLGVRLGSGLGAAVLADEVEEEEGEKVLVKSVVVEEKEVKSDLTSFWASIGVIQAEVEEEEG